MKILFLSTRCGDGHNAMARAYENECKSRGIDTKIYDIFGELPKEYALFNKGYIWAVKHIPKIYNKIWLANRKRIHGDFTKSYCRTMRNVFVKIKEQIDEFRPDIVVTMFVNAGGAVEYLKKQGLIDKNLVHVAVVFDYVICPDFDYNRTADYTITSHEIVHDELLQKGFASERLKCFGIPVDGRFLQKYDKQQMRQELGFKDKFTVLTMAGGAGIGNTPALIKSIVKADKDIQIVAVCGRNKKAKIKLEKYIKKHNLDNIVPFGFTDKIPQIMNACDLAFTRGGGSGTTECFQSGLPMIFRQGLITNEKLNMQIFNGMGIGDNIKKDRHAGKKAVYYKQNQHLLDEMREKIDKFAKKQSAKNAVDFLCTLV